MKSSWARSWCAGPPYSALYVFSCSRGHHSNLHQTHTKTPHHPPWPPASTPVGSPWARPPRRPGLHAGGTLRSSFSAASRPARRWDLGDPLLRVAAGLHAGGTLLSILFSRDCASSAPDLPRPPPPQRYAGRGPTDARRVGLGRWSAPGRGAVGTRSLRPLSSVHVLSAGPTSRPFPQRYAGRGPSDARGVRHGVIRV